MQNMLILLSVIILLVSCSNTKDNIAENNEEIQEIQEKVKNNETELKTTINKDIDSAVENIENTSNNDLSSFDNIDSTNANPLDNSNATDSSQDTIFSSNEELFDDNSGTNLSTDEGSSTSLNEEINTGSTNWETTSEELGNPIDEIKNETEEFTNSFEETKSKTEDLVTSFEENVNDTANEVSNNESIASVGDVILVVHTTGYVEDEDKVKVIEAIKSKWFTGNPQEIDKKSYDNNIETYLGRSVLVASIVKGYGEYEIAVRTAKIHKFEDGYIGEKPLKKWSTRGIQTATDLVKEIKYADDLFSEE